MQAPRLLRQFARNPVVQRSCYHDHPPLTTYNDLPSPQGNWKTHFDAKQRKYNAQLLLGIGVLTGSVLFGHVAGFLDGHNDIPERPADIPSYK